MIRSLIQRIRAIGFHAIVLTVVLALTIMAVLPQASSNPGLDVTVETDKITYVLREIVTIYGNVTYDGQNITEGFASIQVKNPRGSSILFRTVPVGSIPSKRWGVEIISAYACDETGNPKTKFERGKWAYFKMTVKNNEVVQQEVVMTVTVFDSDMILLGSSSSKVTIDPGKTASYIPAIWIDYWASTGTAFVYFNAYTDYPENNGYPYCPERMANFTIIESIYEEPPANPPPEQPIQNGSYQTQFRLTPEPLPGTYYVYACAWYEGWKALATTTFTVEDVEAPPRASFVALPPLAGPNQTITFDASYSSPEGYNDTIVEYQWDLGDGTKASGKRVSHSYTEEGNYTVTLNVTDSEGFWNITTKKVTIKIIHDVSVVRIECLKEIYNDWLAEIKVTVKNKGTYPETFNLTVYHNMSIIETVTISDLGILEEKTVTIIWDTSGLVPLTNYTVWAEASLLSEEFNASDNQLIYGLVHIKLLGDVNFDRIIDISDVVMVTSTYALTEDSPNWNPETDLQPDGVIDISDVVKVTSIYWTTY